MLLPSISTPARNTGALLFMLGALALAGCSSGIATDPPSQTPAGSPSAGGTVTLVTYDSYAVSKKVLADFTAETGVTIKIARQGDAAEMVNRAILTKENPEGDVLFGVDQNTLARAVDNGLFQPFTSKESAAVPPKFQAEPAGIVTPIDYGDVCVNYDAEAFDRNNVEPPTTMADLAKPEYKDQLVVENPATSTPGLAFLLATVAKFGEPGAWDYWQSLKDNGVLAENSWDSAYYQQFSGGSGEGKRPLVVSYASSPAAEVVFAEEPPKNGKAPTGVLLDTCYQQVEYAGQLANASNQAGAQALIDFMLSKRYQEDLPLQNFVFPVLPSAQLPKVFTDNAQTADQPLLVPIADVTANRDAWVQRWTDIVAR